MHTKETDPRAPRRAIAQDTRKHFPALLRLFPDKLPDAVRRTRFYASTEALEPVQGGGEEGERKTVVRVVNGDTIDVGAEVRDRGLNPCLLNMASHSNPGGGWTSGARAQEEDLFLRSTYALSLCNTLKLDTDRTWTYPIPPTGGIYSPDVCIFRDAEYTVLPTDEIHFLSFMAVPAVRRPQLVDNGTRMSDTDAALTLSKMRTALRIAALNGHDAVVLGAMGCGAFRNPPGHVAELFERVLCEEEFKDRFREVVFAVLDKKGEGNFRVFWERFVGGERV
ncbi:hypothetical protein HK104_006114, partial [Borealophlyctis nickersoniae]